MSKTILSVFAVLLCALLVSPLQAYALDSGASVKQASRLPGTVPVMAGDRLKLSFLETVFLPTGTGGGQGRGKDKLVRSFFERADLSGEYEIDTEGQLVHGILGSLPAAGKSLRQLERDLARAHKASSKKDINIRVSYVLRPPVYVKGFIAAPGAYKYVSGMTVSHAVTLASGHYRKTDTRLSAEEINRRTLRLKQAQRKLASALVQKQRVKAEFAGGSRIDMPRQLPDLVGKKRAGQLIATQARILARLSRSRTHSQAALERAVKLADSSIATLKKLRMVTGKQSEVAGRTLDRFRRRLGSDFRQASNKSQEMLARMVIQQLELQHKNGKISNELFEAERKKTEAERALAKYQFDNTIDLSNRLDLIAAQIVDLEADIAVLKSGLPGMSQLQKNTPLKTQGGLQKELATYEIKRWSKGTLLTFQANENSRLIPGDILNISVRR